MPHHKIKSEQDIRDLIERYDDASEGIFEILETGEEMSLADLLYLYDGQQITIQHI